ncbi:MAG: hypothetical protein GY867_07420 [bacterium]|nr:hypothetical protein [bacterium]
MRIHDTYNDQTLRELSLFLTTDEIARLYGLLGSMLGDIRAKETSLGDESYEHVLTVHRYSPSESTGFTPRQKQLLEGDA